MFDGVPEDYADVTLPSVELFSATERSPLGEELIKYQRNVEMKRAEANVTEEQGGVNNEGYDRIAAQMQAERDIRQDLEMKKHFEMFNATPSGQEAIMKGKIDIGRDYSSIGQTEISSLEKMKQVMEQQGYAALLQQEVEAQEEANNVTPVDRVYSDLAIKEGTGDNLTSVATGKWGVTEAARAAVGAPPEMPDEEVAKAYLEKVDSNWKNREGYDQAPDNIQAMLIDATYNLGEGVLGYKGVQKALKDGDWEMVGKNLLDTANAEGGTVKGLAKRRAEGWNIAFPGNPITKIEQKDSGEILYYGADGSTIFSYGANKGKHPGSEAGVMEIHQ